MRKGRVTVGFLSANIHVGAGRTVWPGILDAALENDVNLICFPGGRLAPSVPFEAPRNAIYDLIALDRIDGLVSWASTVGGALPPEAVSAFHRRYRPLPLVSLAQPLDGGASLMIDSYQGMAAAVAHLIETHGFRRLAFIRGPESHFYAGQRYRAYLDVLARHGIAVRDRLVTPPLHWEAGADAMEILLDERGLVPGRDFEAIVAVSDLLALEALKVLQGRGFSVPGDVAVVGFNDSAEGRLTTPPLTSVAMPLYQQGKQALELLLAWLAGGAAPGQVVLPSRLVVRESCGCPSQSVLLAAAGDVGCATATLDDAIPDLAGRVSAEMAQATGGGEPATERAAALLAAFRAELAGGQAGQFLAAVDAALSWAVGAGYDAGPWQRAISILRRRTLPYLDQAARARAEDLWGQARVVIGRTAQHFQVYQQLRSEHLAEALREIGQALVSTFDVARLTAELAERLPRIGIASCYLACYDNATRQADGRREWSRLVLGYSDGRSAALPPGGLRFPSRQLVPRELLPRRRHSLVVEPLYFGDEAIGFAVFETGPRDGAVYEVLGGHISSALKGALLMAEAQEARLAAEKADQIKTRLLANVSHELRTPLNIIVEHAAAALGAGQPDGIEPPSALQHDLEQIRRSAEHQLRVINDLLDLSRTEINALDLYPELLDPLPLLEEAFSALAECAAGPDKVCWRLALPERLPLIQGDPVRLRQVLLNLLSNARKFTREGEIVLGAEAAPPRLHVWIKDTGLGIPRDQQERIFEPFVTGNHPDQELRGIGLGLSITRRLVQLHDGEMAVDSVPGQGSTFHVFLPLPTLAEQAGLPCAAAAAQGSPVLLVIATAQEPADEILDLGRRQGLEIRRLRPGENPDLLLEGLRPAAVAWDLAATGPGDWALAHRLRSHPALGQAPFLVYAGGPDAPTRFVVKPAGREALWEALAAACPQEVSGTVLIVDDDPAARELSRAAVVKALPGYEVRLAGDGLEALAILAGDAPLPGLVILDLMMPGLDGFDVLDRLRGDPRTRQVPVVIFSARPLTREDVRRLEPHAGVTLQTKGILSEAETGALLHRLLFGDEALPPQTGALVKRAVAYLQQHHGRPLTRWEVADAVGVSEDYLARVFRRELGLSPWDYLARYRVMRAMALLRAGDESIGAIARQVGMNDQAYFSRAFHKATGLSPRAYRAGREPSTR